MPLKPATTRDCGGGVQFTAEITGTSIIKVDRSFWLLVEEDGTRKKENQLVN